MPNNITKNHISERSENRIRVYRLMQKSNLNHVFFSKLSALKKDWIDQDSQFSKYLQQDCIRIFHGDKNNPKKKKERKLTLENEISLPFQKYNFSWLRWKHDTKKSHELFTKGLKFKSKTMTNYNIQTSQSSLINYDVAK